MLIREAPATELTLATRVLAHAGLLEGTRRITSLVGEVVYVCARGIASGTMTPYDVVAVRLRDGLRLQGEPPGDIALYLDRHREWPAARSVVRMPDASFIAAPSVPECALLALRSARPPTDGAGSPGGGLTAAWEEQVAIARVAGALFGAEP